jgi:hypothetical protein
MGIALSLQEMKIINYCENKPVVCWEHLAQFGKDPTTIKKATLQKIISDIKRKYREMNVECPLKSSFKDMLDMSAIKDKLEKQMSFPINETLGAAKISLDKKPIQHLVQIKTTPSGNIIPMGPKQILSAQKDFAIDKAWRRVRTRSGIHPLGQDEFLVMNYLVDNAEELIPMEKLRDVVYPNFGSKIPPRWFDSISRMFTKLRKSIPEIRTRLHTIRTDGNTFYMLK